MLERLTSAARATVAEAEREEAGPRVAGHGRRAPARGGDAPLPARRPRVPAWLVPYAPDTEALAAIAISLADVGRAVQEALGPDVWDAPRDRRHLRFFDGAKRPGRWRCGRGSSCACAGSALTLLQLLGLLREEGPSGAAARRSGRPLKRSAGTAQGRGRRPRPLSARQTAKRMWSTSPSWTT